MPAASTVTGRGDCGVVNLWETLLSSAPVYIVQREWLKNCQSRRARKTVSHNADVSAKLLFGRNSTVGKWLPSRSAGSSCTHLDACSAVEDIETPTALNSFTTVNGQDL